MKTTGIFTFERFVIPIENYGEPILLIPFGDIHRSTALCHIEKWLEWCQWAKTLKNAFFLGMGDYIDLSSTSERRVLANDLHDTTLKTFEDLYKKETEKFYKEISFMKGRVIGLLEGNHYSVLQSGITTTQLMCDWLECKYLGVSCFLRISFLKKTLNSRYSNCIDLWVHHGSGAGQTVGASINKIEQMTKMAEADIYLMGHDHRKQVAMNSRLKLSGSSKSIYLENRKIIMARTGTFLRGYVKGEKSYVADRGLHPSDIGTITITMTPKRSNRRNMSRPNIEREDFRWIDLNASL